VFQQTDKGVRVGKYLVMQMKSTPRVTFADRFSDGLLISFDDGSRAFYSSSLLYATFSQATEIKQETKSDE
jgi:hypothetical protein